MTGAAKLEIGDRHPARNGAGPKSGSGTIKRVTILGATGSIGKSTLDLIARHPDGFEIVALTAQDNVADLAREAIRVRARLAVIGNADHYDELKRLLSG